MKLFKELKNAGIKLQLFSEPSDLKKNTKKYKSKAEVKELNQNFDNYTGGNSSGVIKIIPETYLNVEKLANSFLAYDP